MSTNHVAYSQGENDAREGYGRNSCPYQHEPFRTEWLRGFDRQKTAAENAEVQNIGDRDLGIALGEFEADAMFGGDTITELDDGRKVAKDGSGKVVGMYDSKTKSGWYQNISKVKDPLGWMSNLQKSGDVVCLPLRTLYALPVRVLPNTLQDGSPADDSGCTHVVVSELLDAQNCNHKVALCFDARTAEHIARLWNENLD